MNKNRFLNGLLVVLFLVAAGTKDGYCQQNYTYNYFWSGQPSVALPANFDTTTFTNEEKVLWEMILSEMEEFTDDYCEEDRHFWYPTSYFEADENELIGLLQLYADTVYKKDGYIVWKENIGDNEEYAIHLNSLIFEIREYDNIDNPFFDEVGNNLWGLNRLIFKRINGYIIPDKEISIYYDDEDILPGILCEVTMTYSYLYFELIDDNDSTVAKTGNESLYKNCMGGGHTGIKEIQQVTEIKMYPNPATEQVTFNLPLYMNENVDIKIYNTLGLTVLSQHHANGEQVNMDIKSLPAGIYVVRCMKNDKVISTRFVKQ